MRIYLKNVDKLTEDEYIMARKDSFGASDVAALFGMGFQTLEQVIALKQKKYVTEEEREVGRKPNVRKGKELESLILQKVMEKETSIKLIKPNDMYEILPGLTVNFDALDEDNIPYELKYVSTFGKNAWDLKRSTTGGPYQVNEYYGHNIKDHITYWSGMFGIPPYYYTQIQTQLFGANKNMGYVCALFEHDWELRIYRIYRDPYFEVAVSKAVKTYGPRLMDKYVEPNEDNM